MAIIGSHESSAGVVEGTTWGTAVQADKCLLVNSLGAPVSRASVRTSNHKRGYLPGQVKAGRETVDFSAGGMASFGENWTFLYALFAGTSPAPTEVTGAQGDYLHEIDIATTHNRFMSVAWEHEDDVVAELPSVKLGSFGFNFQENELISWSTSGIADSKVTDNSGAPATTNAQLDALTEAQDDEVAYLNGANMYVRLGAYSTVTALSSADDVNLATGSISLTRPISRYYGTRGASTPDTYEPYQSGLTAGQFSITLAAIDDSVSDLVNTYLAGTYMMAEIYVDGKQIGTGTNTSHKFQLPYLLPVTQDGDGISGQATLQQPTLTFEMAVPSAAPNGMTGVTNLMRLATVNERTTAYLT